MQAALTIKNERNGWVVVSSDKRTQGPYRNIGVTLQVAIIEVFAMRKRGQVSSLLVHDDYGTPRHCRLNDGPYNPDNCSTCEQSWNTGARALAPKCLVWAEIKDSFTGAKRASIKKSLDLAPT